MWFESATLAKEYRADIDGLRAVAVMLVLTFHLGFDFLRGGFGALVVLASTYRLRNRIANELVFAAGFGLVIYTAFAFSEATAFPGASALVPCLGAGLAIYSRKSAISARVLGNGMSVAVGRVSYSLYLIHWPLLVFYQYWKFLPLSIAERLGILAISVVLAFVMYKYVETPFRDRDQRRYPTPPKFWIRCAGVALAVAASGASAMAQDG